MARPVVSDAAEDLYAALEPAFTQYDEGLDWPALNLCAAFVSGDIDLIYQLVLDSDAGPGWQILLDPDRCPAAFLPWLAQVVGATLRPDMDEAARRAAIKSPEAFGRGTIEAIEAVAKRRLTGTKTVIVEERYTGLAWRLRIVTLEEETPDPALTESEITAEQKPIGILLYFNRRVNWIWGEVRVEPAWDTWSEVKAGFASWFAFRTYEP